MIEPSLALEGNPPDTQAWWKSPELRPPSWGDAEERTEDDLAFGEGSYGFPVERRPAQFRRQWDPTMSITKADRKLMKSPEWKGQG